MSDFVISDFLTLRDAEIEQTTNKNDTERQHGSLSNKLNYFFD